MAWFHYNQNNSGGSFDFDETAGITHHVVIEAKNAWLADQRAQFAGIYFDGCDSGRDCSCCGDRWYSAAGEDGDEVPMVYGQPANAYEGWGGWMAEGKEIAVHTISGEILWYGETKKVDAA